MNNSKMFLSFIAISHLFAFNAFGFSQAELHKAKKRMIEESISLYSGNCPCPYNSMRNGRSCGKRSAYSRPGGAAPLCYPKDILDKEAEKYLNDRR